MQGSGRSMVVIDMVKVNWKPLDCFGNAGIPSRIKNGGIKVIHPWRVRVGLSLSAKNRRVQKHIGDIAQCMVLDFNVVGISQDSDFHWRCPLVFRIVDTPNARYDPDQVLMAETFAHQLCHNAQATDLDLYAPVFNIVLHCGNENCPSSTSSSIGV